MARNNQSGGTRRQRTAIEARRDRVFLAWSKGEAQHLIAKREKVHRGQICRDLNHALAELQSRRLDDREGHLLDMLGKLAFAESELLAAWERSKKDRERRRVKKVKGDKPREESELATDGRDGDMAIWAQLLKNWEMQAKLLGLLKHEVGATFGPVTITIVEEVRQAIIAKAATPHAHELIEEHVVTAESNSPPPPSAESVSG